MIYIAGDKHGYKAIKIVEDYLKEKNLDYQNLGTQSEDEDMKLEDMIPNAIDKIKADGNNKGILTCGTGIGVEVGANKFSGIRACLAIDPKMAEWSVVYDKCNVLCLVGWDVEREKVYKILDKWFKAEYDGSEKRLKMFEAFNKWH